MFCFASFVLVFPCNLVALSIFCVKIGDCFKQRLNTMAIHNLFVFLKEKWANTDHFNWSVRLIK